MRNRESTSVNIGKVFSLALLVLPLIEGCSRLPSVNSKDSTVRGNTAYTSAGSGAGSAPVAPQLRRLSNFELNNTILSLLGDTSQSALTLPPDEESLGYTNGYNIGVNQLFLDQWQQLARQIAAQAVKTGSALQLQNASCLARSDSSVCADTFINDFGKLSFRRPLNANEKLELKKVFNTGLALGTFEQGQQILIETILIAPSFLYKTELGSGDTANVVAYELTPYELASQLSYALTGFPPDAALMASADSGAIRDKAEYSAQAQRLMQTDRGLGLWRDFIFHWLKISAVDSIQRSHSQWSDTLPKAFRAETEAFINHVMTAEQGSLVKLLGADYSFLDKQLAPFYGAGASNEKSPILTTTNPAERKGILTQASFLSVHAQVGGSSPVRRGLVVLQRLFCHNLPPPPPGVAVVPAANANGTTRDRFAAHSKDSSCQGCHSHLDPIGFAFENYDGLGVYRSQENGIAVDATGTLTGHGDADGAFNNALELVDRMAASKDVHECVTKQLFRYVMGRMETDGDEETLSQSLLEAETKGMDLRAAMLSIVNSDPFRQRLSGEQNQ